MSVRIDGRDVESWTVTPSAPSFLRLIPLAEGALACAAPWCVLEIRATAPGGAATGIVAIDQFDLQAPETPMTRVRRGMAGAGVRSGARGSRGGGRAAGPNCGRAPTDRDVELQIVGESPRRYFDRPSRVRASAGGAQLLSAEAGSDFAWSVRVPASALRASGGAITIETDQVFRPADRGQGADRRDTRPPRLPA